MRDAYWEDDWDDDDRDDPDDDYLLAQDRHDEMLEAIRGDEDDDGGFFGRVADRFAGGSDEDEDDFDDDDHDPDGGFDFDRATVRHGIPGDEYGEWDEGDDLDDLGDDPLSANDPDDDDQMGQLAAAVQRMQSENPDWGAPPQDVLDDPVWEESGEDQGMYFHLKYGDPHPDEFDDSEGDFDHSDGDDDSEGGIWSRVKGFFGGGEDHDEGDEWDFGDGATIEELNEYAEGPPDYHDHHEIPEYGYQDSDEAETPDPELINEANEKQIEQLDEEEHADDDTPFGNL